MLLILGGKSLKDHLEATNHAAAFDFVIGILKAKKITEDDILQIHRLILKGIDDQNAGFYRNIPVRISGSAVVLPNYKKIPDLMAKLIEDINDDYTDSIIKSIQTHYDLVATHPFTDGNGRTARLLMNLILMKYGYPPMIIKPKNRLQYLKSLEKSQLGLGRDDYNQFMLYSLNETLKIYLKAIEGHPIPGMKSNDSLLKIGRLAKEAGETNATIRYWTKLGLIEASGLSEGGYHLYDSQMIARCKKIRKLQAERYTLEEILKTVDNLT